MTDNGQGQKMVTYTIKDGDIPFLEFATGQALGGILAQAPPPSIVTDVVGATTTRQIMKPQTAAKLAVDYATTALVALRIRITNVKEAQDKQGPQGVVPMPKPEPEPEGEKK